LQVCKFEPNGLARGYGQMTNKKSEMISFMKQYFDFTDERARECFDTFVEKMEDGMLFSCCW